MSQKIGKTVISLPKKKVLGKIVSESEKTYKLDTGKRPRKDSQNIKWKISHHQQQQQKPEHWPSNQSWPLQQGVKISQTIETFPPIYVLSNGKQIKGTL